MKQVVIFVFLMLFSVVSFAQENSLILVTHDSFSVSEEALALFEEETGITIQILTLGDTGQLVNQSILSKKNPLGDVLFGVDNTFLSRALDAEIFLPYASDELENVPETFLQVDNFVTPISYGDVCINYDIAYFEAQSLPLPQSLSDLTDPLYKDLLVVQNPATSSPGLAFLMATIATFGEGEEDGYLAFWRALVANGALIVDGWETAYFGYFSAVAEDGSYPMVVSYASSPPFTLDEETQKATTASLVGDSMCFRQVEFAGILKGTSKETEAQLWIDFMLSEAFQEDVPLQMYVFPVRYSVILPDEFMIFAQIPDVPAFLDSESIEENRDRWVQEWVEEILR